MTADIRIEHDIEGRRFVAQLPTGTAVLAYASAGNKVLDLFSTYVPAPARGQGIAARLVEAALAYARTEGYRILPTCWYVADYIGEHPEYRDLVAA